MNKRVLVTGGNGFIGTHLCKKLQERGYDFRVLTQKVTPFFAPETIREIDLQDTDGLERLMNEYRPDVVMHLAAIASPAFSDSSTLYRVNVCGTENLLQAAKKCLPQGTKIVLISTAGVYGNQDVEFLHEELPFNPVNHYSFSKMIVEYLSRQYKDYLDIQIVRPFNIIGSGQTQTFLIPKLVEHFRKRIPKLTMGNMDAVRDYVSVDFCTEVLFDLMEMKDSIHPAINICSGKGYSCWNVVEILEELTGHTPEIQSTNEFIRPNEIWRLVGDTTKLDSFIKGKYHSQDLRTIIEEMLSM